MSVYRGDPSNIRRPIWAVLTPGVHRVGTNRLATVEEGSEADKNATPPRGKLLESPIESPVIRSMAEGKQEAFSPRRGGA